MGTSAPGPPPNCGRFACGTKSGHHRGCGTGGNVGPGAWAHAESLEEAERERLERVVSGIDRYGGGYGYGGGTTTRVRASTASGFGGGGGAETTTGGATPGGRGNLSTTRRRRLIHARRRAGGGTGTTEGVDVEALGGPLIRVRPLTSEYGEAVQIGGGAAAAIGEDGVEEDEELEEASEEEEDEEGGDGEGERDFNGGTRGARRRGVVRAEVAVIRDGE